MESILPLLFLVITILGLALGALVLQADRRRWDNRIFAAMCIVDATTEAIRGAVLLDGATLLDKPALHACTTGTILIAYLTIEFAYSFPFNRRLPRDPRILAAAGVILGLILLNHPSTHEYFKKYVSFLFFLPYFCVTLFLLAQNLRRLNDDGSAAGIRLVMLALALRWISGMATFMVASRISEDVFAFMVFFDATVAVFISYVLIAHSILKHHLFRVRGVLADAVLYGGFLVALVALLSVSVELVLARATSPLQLRVLLVVVAILPVGLLTAGRHVFPKIEQNILRPLDPRRAEMKAVLEKFVHDAAQKVDPEDLFAVAESAVTAITSGGKASFMPGSALAVPRDELESAPAALAAHLASIIDPYLHRAHAHGLSEKALADLARTRGDLFVPIRRSLQLFGVLTVEGGELDRDAVLTLVGLANHLALKLENYCLFSQMLSLESELEESRRLAGLGSFAAAIAHDLRTPLTSIQMNVQILRGKVSLPPDDMEYFDIALEELKRLNTHITELLDYAKPIQVKRSRIDLRDVADDAAKRLEPILTDRKVRLERDYAEALPAVLADPTRLRQVLLNLLENALHATPQGGTITLRARAADAGQIALDVADTGRGIDAEHLGKIFEPFFTTRPDGTGLGLSIAQKLIRAHGGDIRVLSTPGEGSTFTIVLPVVGA